MQAKQFYTSLALAVEHHPKPFTSAHARVASMRRQLEGYRSHFDDRMRTPQSTLTPITLDKLLRDSSLLAAEVMEDAEHEQEACEADGMDEIPGVQQLADTCFDLILELSSQRQELNDFAFESEEAQSKRRDRILWCTLKGLAKLDQKLKVVLAD